MLYVASSVEALGHCQVARMASRSDYGAVEKSLIGFLYRIPVDVFEL